MQMIRKGLIFSSFLIIFSCGVKKEQTETISIETVPLKEKVIIENTWGLEFKSTPIALIKNKKIKDLSKAVGLIQYDTNGSATGFFVNDKGLFLTNHHVVAQSYCTKGKCREIKIIRDFRPGGDFEIHSRLRVLAHNKDLDYALIQVDLAKGQTVPFIPLAGLTNKSNLENGNLKIIGHPFGGALRVANAKFDYQVDADIELKSVAISGNSGSPMIDQNTAQAVGLYYSSTWSKASIQKNGSVEHFGYSYDMEDILNNIKKGFDINQGDKGLNVKRRKEAPADLDIFPKEDISLEKIVKKNWASQFLNTENESKAFNIALEKEIRTYEKNTVKNDTRVYGLLAELNYIELYRESRMINISKGNNEKLNSLFGKDLDNILRPLNVRRSILDKQKCLVEIKNRKIHYNLRSAGRFCLSQKNTDGEDILQKTIEVFKEYKESYSDTDLYQLSRIFMTQFLLRKGEVLKKDKELVLEALKWISDNTSNWSFSMKAEKMYTFILMDYFKKIKWEAQNQNSKP